MQCLYDQAADNSSIVEQAKNKTTVDDFALAIESCSLSEFQFSEEFILELWEELTPHTPLDYVNISGKFFTYNNVFFVAFLFINETH